MGPISCATSAGVVGAPIQSNKSRISARVKSFTSQGDPGCSSSGRAAKCAYHGGRRLLNSFSAFTATTIAVAQRPSTRASVSSRLTHGFPCATCTSSPVTKLILSTPSKLVRGSRYLLRSKNINIKFCGKIQVISRFPEARSQYLCNGDGTREDSRCPRGNVTPVPGAPRLG